MNFGISDIAAGVRLAYELYDKGFSEENRADVRYKNFENDIRNFRTLLDKLKEALIAAHERYENRGPIPTVDSTPHDPLCDELIQERKDIIGDFESTLRDCDLLLKKNKHLRQRHNNVLDNLKYYLTQQEQRVDDLRRRIHFHSEKIRFVIDRLSIRLLTDLDAKVDDIRAVVDENLQLSQDILREVVEFRYSLFGYLSGARNLPPSPAVDIHAVGGALAARLQANLTLNAPTGRHSGIPIKQGFDALLLFFEQSVEGSDHTPEQYLLFLKARWFYDRLKESRGYAQARPGAYYKRAINQIGQAIAVKIRQPDRLVSYDEDTLMALPDSNFLIWPQPTTTEPIRSDEASPLMLRGNERCAVCIEFPSVDPSELDSITVFQSSPDDFRIVNKTARVSESGKIRDQITELEVNCLEDKLIPRYALPTLIEPSREIVIRNKKGEKFFQFDSIQKLLRFQAAMTGYDIPYDCERIQCQFSEGARALDCTGRIQLWQEPVELTQSSTESSQSQSAPSRQQSSFSQSSRSRYDSLAPSLMSTKTVQETNGGWQADIVKSSAVVMYTQLNNEFVTIFVSLDQGIGVDQFLCTCYENYNKCSIMALTASKADGFTVLVLRPERSSSRAAPNPNTFDIFPLRLPRHPQLRRVSQWKAEFLMLKFKTLPDKRRFHDELLNTAHIREIQRNDKTEFEKEVRYLADQPVRIKESVGGQTVAWSSTNESSGILVPTRKKTEREQANDDHSTLQSEQSTASSKSEKRKRFHLFKR